MRWVIYNVKLDNDPIWFRIQRIWPAYEQCSLNILVENFYYELSAMSFLHYELSTMNFIWRTSTDLVAPSQMLSTGTH